MYNMKRLSNVASAAILLFVSLNAAANQYSPYTSRFYLGGEIGYGDLHYKNSEFAEGFSNVDDTGLAGRIFLGFDINRYIGFEVGYTAYSNPEFKIADTNTDFNQGSLDLLGKVSLPVSCDLSVHAKAGVAYVHRDDLSVHVDNVIVKSEESDDQTRPVLGVGLSYAFNPRVSGEIDFARTFGTSDLEDADFYGVGLSVKLG